MATDTACRDLESVPLRRSRRHGRDAACRWEPPRPGDRALPTADAISLRDGEVWTHQPHGTPLRIRCTSGIVWVTQEGDAGDVVLRRGETVVTRTRGKVAVQALTDASFRSGAVTEQRAVTADDVA